MDRTEDRAAPVDLRSDTVTRPDARMRKAIAAAEVGDDVLGDDPTVKELERVVAAMLGKESALFLPSGTMANQAAIACHVRPGDEVILERNSHVLLFEAGAAAALSGASLLPLDGDCGLLSVDAVRASIRPPFPHNPRTALLWLENTHNAAGGTVWPLDRLAALHALARDAGLGLHLDGARIWNAAVAQGTEPAEIAAHADTVSVCMSKGLGAPVGSLLAGPTEFVERAWIARKRMGGGMRQSGLLAAAALYALEHHLPRLAEDHANARCFAEAIAGVAGVEIDPESVETNIAIFDIARSGLDPSAFAEDLAARGVLVIPIGGTRVRAVTHFDVTRENVRHAAACVAEVLAV
ncbi:MAG: GntG family PLP-dependent aldolase [Gemmatimonadota bacterium]|nr:GntG family PLP-dependent aldolase [Gemmatimonadota bacterium]